MPLSYGDGTLAEHRACRTDSVMFDVSHLGTVRVEGDGAFDRLQSALSNDLRRVAPGRAQYTHLLDDDGSVVDDIIVWWLADQTFDVMPNASNTASVVGAVGGKDSTDSRCIIAIQGPHARARLATVAPEAATVPRFGVMPFVWDGVACVVARTVSNAPFPPTPPKHCGRRCWPPAFDRLDSAPATPCASRRASLCTGTSSDRASPPSKPAWDGSSVGTNLSSEDGRPWWRSASAACPVGWSD
jgi:sarcosine oxidase gamma subunit